METWCATTGARHEAPGTGDRAATRPAGPLAPDPPPPQGARFRVGRGRVPVTIRALALPARCQQRRWPCHQARRWDRVGVRHHPAGRRAGTTSGTTSRPRGIPSWRGPESVSASTAPSPESSASCSSPSTSRSRPSSSGGPSPWSACSWGSGCTGGTATTGSRSSCVADRSGPSDVPGAADCPGDAGHRQLNGSGAPRQVTVDGQTPTTRRTVTRSPSSSPLGLAHPRLHRHDVPPVLREQRGRPPGFPDLRRDRDHPPAVAHHRGRRLQVTALRLRHGDEVPRRRALPEPHLPAELQVHRLRIGDRRHRADGDPAWGAAERTGRSGAREDGQHPLHVVAELGHEVAQEGRGLLVAHLTVVGEHLGEKWM